LAGPDRTRAGKTSTLSAIEGLVKSAETMQALARVLFAGVLQLSDWHSRETFSIVACCAYIVVCAGLGIRWFQWDTR
jgi:hypothetical protein